MESKAQVVRGWKKVAVAIALVCAIGIAGLFVTLIYRHAVHRAWYDHVQLLILKLAPRCPPDVTPARWANCLGNTWNLHVNYGGPSFFDSRLREPFVIEFERRLEGPVGLDTIDWIWDEYARCVPPAKGYGSRFRPTTPESLQLADEIDSGQPGANMSLDDWLRMLRERDPSSDQRPAK